MDTQKIINKHIDFDGIFNSLIKAHKEKIEEYQYEDEDYKYLLKFLTQKEQFEIVIEECELNPDDIIFYYKRKERTPLKEKILMQAFDDFQTIYDISINDFINICIDVMI